MYKYKGYNKKRNYFLTLLGMGILMFIFYNSFYWPYDEFSKRKLLVFMITILGIGVVPVFLIKSDGYNRWVQVVLQRVVSMQEHVKRDKKKYGLIVCFGAVLFGSAYFITYLASFYLLKTNFNVHILYLILTVMVIFLFAIANWKQAAQKPEWIFAVLTFTIGLFCIGVVPDRVGVSWDDQIHYQRTLEISNYLNGIDFAADINNIGEAPFYGKAGYDQETDYEYKNNIEALYETKECQFSDYKDFGVFSLAYVPAALGIIFARGLGMSYVGVFNMGRIFNLLMYIIIISLAIKKVKYGKVLIAAVGMIPTTVFMAASYSYDPWIVALLILGFAYFFAELQADEPLQYKNIVIMLSAIVLGCLPKAIYFPLLCPLLFMPEKKFKNSRQKKVYRFAIMCLGLFLIGTFMIPMLVQGAGTGDIRGGADVNATEQIIFILKNPLMYLRTVYNFFVDYIAFQSSAQMLQGFAYVGTGHFYSIVSVVLIALAFLDRGEYEKNIYMIKGVTLLSNTVAMILASTALYISFTAVASNSIAGMQGRYLLPTIYPALHSIGLGGTKNKIDKNAFVWVPLLIIAVTFVYNLTKFCVIYY